MKLFHLPEEVVEAHRDALSDKICMALLGLREKWTDKTVRLYIDELIDPLTNHEKVIAQDIKRLSDLVTRIDALKSAHLKLTAEWDLLESDLRGVFRYEALFRDAKEWNSGKYIESLIANGLAYCPYCNAQALIAYPIDDRGDYHKGAVDHYYDKAAYPYLALSIYNLVPVCNRCNNLKGTKKVNLITHTHPFVDDFDKLMAFSYASDNPQQTIINPKGIDNLTVRLEMVGGNRSAEAGAFSSMLETELLYNSGAILDIARKTITKCEKYPLSALEQISKITKCNIEECIKDAFGVSLDGSDINQCECGKLVADLIRPVLSDGAN